MHDIQKPEIGLGKVEIRHMLLLAGEEPLRTAVALRHDGKAIITLDRHKPPRTLDRELKEAVPDAHEHRFGTFGVDPHDPRLARFVVNRAAPGMARKLVIALRGTGLRRVEIGPEDGQDVDGAEDDDSDGYAQVFDPAAQQRALDDEQASEHAALSRLLSDLAHRIADAAGTDHTRKALLTQTAETAQAALKRNDLVAAAHALRALRDAMQ